jgi:ectoine hydroxylase-related dioxygenase (phytanoyl-CoA dioxygenase family)
MVMVASGGVSDWRTIGAAHYPGALSVEHLALLADVAARVAKPGPGARIVGDPGVKALVKPGSVLHQLAASHIGAAARAVRAVFFNKTATTNWALGWHQDRTIAVRRKAVCPGYGPWSVKTGIVHVEPPFALIEGMVTLRAHLDPCGPDNAPLLIVPGSHRLGRQPSDQIAALVARHGTRACLADAGDVWLYATAIIHASNAATNPTQRRVLQVDFSAASLPAPLHWLGV